MAPRNVYLCRPEALANPELSRCGFGVDFFNADDRAAALNRGSYLNIPPAIRDEVNILFEWFVQDHIERRTSCAFETRLRSGITFDQAALARPAGFMTEMR